MRKVLLVGAVLAVLLGLAGFIAAAPEPSAAAKGASTHGQSQRSPLRKSNKATKSTVPAAFHKSPHHNWTRWADHTLRLGDRGLAVRGLQWMLLGTTHGPNIRPANKACASCVNHSRRYWHIRHYKPTGRYARQTVLEVQTLKRRLGYPVGRANGDAGPKLRLYLIGAKPLPKDYRARAQKRYNVWRSRLHTQNPWVSRVLKLANQAIAWSDHYFYTQSPHRSDFLNGIGPPWPKGGDCSGSVSALYKLAGGPATGSVFPYDWTGSMQDRGHVVWRAGESLTKLKPGDLVFYGYGGAPYTHVAMVISKDGGRVYTFGNDACPCNSSTLYRSDVRIARRYP